MTEAQLPVVVVHWNQPDRCADTVRLFLDQSPAVVVLVVDNGSRPEALAAVELLAGPRVEVHRLGTNQGYGPGANHGLRLAFGRPGVHFVAVAPHDTLPEDGCLPRLYDALAADPRRGLVSANYADSQVQRYNWLKGMHLVPSPPFPAGWTDVMFPHGTLMMVRKECLDEIGVFDPRYFAYSEEHDLGWRATRAGWRVGVVGDAVIGNPDRTAGSAVVSYLNIRNSLLYVGSRSGVLAAAVRTLVILANTAVLAFRPHARQSERYAHVRLRAVLDYWQGRFGPPPPLA